MKSHSHGAVKMTAMRYDAGRPKAANPVKVQDLSLRDGHQSLFATRGRTEDLLAVAAAMDQVGFHSMEVWGGATFDTSHRFLNEDPWERLRLLRARVTGTPLSMLLRGQNLVGYRNYADDVAEAFVQRACDHGMDIFRVFDALNDFRNFLTVVKVIRKNKKHFQGTICYSLTEPRMGGEVYNLEYYLAKARELEAMGADSICIKDMAGIVAPYDAYELVAALKQAVKPPIHLHTHFTSGMGDLALLKAVEAGVDVIDTCLAPYAYRSSHPAVEPLVASLLGTNRDTGLDLKKLAEIGREMEKHIPKYVHLADATRFAIIDIDVLLHQTPGGMLSNLVNQLREMKELDKLEKVFQALPEVRRELGQLPLVTPTSQIVGIQTVNNVLFDKPGQRYVRITEQVKDLCYGLYGATPRPIDPQVQARALADYPRGQKPITVRPGEILEPELETARKHAGELARDLDELLIYALFPVTGKRFLMWKHGLEKPPAEVTPRTLEDVQRERDLVSRTLQQARAAGPAVLPTPAAPAAGAAPQAPRASLQAFEVYVNGEYFRVEVGAEGRPVIAAGPGPAGPIPAAAPAPAAPVPRAPTAPPPAGPTPAGALVTAPLPGMVVGYKKRAGETVRTGETVVVLEAMKMHNNIEAPCDGTLAELHCREGDSVPKGQPLFRIV
ncbi:MAG: carboxylase [Spirochaetes bacterium RBG_16_67_19]|nr:MAG: carboxylase [Spirochaetes bacterium RBG_16_67_19]